MIGLFLLTSLATQVMPNAAVAVFMAPVALNTASDLNASPYAFVMPVAIAASASFLCKSGNSAYGVYVTDYLAGIAHLPAFISLINFRG